MAQMAQIYYQIYYQVHYSHFFSPRTNSEKGNSTLVLQCTKPGIWATSFHIHILILPFFIIALYSLHYLRSFAINIQDVCGTTTLARPHPNTTVSPSPTTFPLALSVLSVLSFLSSLSGFSGFRWLQISQCVLVVLIVLVVLGVSSKINLKKQVNTKNPRTQEHKKNLG